jgi:hypothetical protein
MVHTVSFRILVPLSIRNQKRISLLVFNQFSSIHDSSRSNDLQALSHSHADTKKLADNSGQKLYNEDVDHESRTNAIKSKHVRKKVRQHINPLASHNQMPVNLNEDWLQLQKGVFENPRLPLCIDIGCAKGAWVLKMVRIIVQYT